MRQTMLQLPFVSSSLRCTVITMMGYTGFGYCLGTLTFKNNDFKGKNNNFYNGEAWETPL